MDMIEERNKNQSLSNSFFFFFFLGQNEISILQNFLGISYTPERK